MIILDQDLFPIEVILSIFAKLRPLTTSEEDVLRIGLRMKLDCLRRRHLSILLHPILNTSSSEVVKGLSVSEILRITSIEKRS